MQSPFRFVLKIAYLGYHMKYDRLYSFVIGRYNSEVSRTIEQYTKQKIGSELKIEKLEDA